MATTLLGALADRFDGYGGLTALVGSSGLYVGQEPEGVALPFVVVTHQGEVPEWTTEKAYTTIATVQFNCYAKGCAAVEAIALQVKGCFDWCQANLNINGATPIRMTRTMYVLAAEAVRASDGALVYRAQLDYEVEVNRTLTS